MSSNGSRAQTLRLLPPPGWLKYRPIALVTGVFVGLHVRASVTDWLINSSVPDTAQQPQQPAVETDERQYRSSSRHSTSPPTQSPSIVDLISSL